VVQLRQERAHDRHVGANSTFGRLLSLDCLVLGERGARLFEWYTGLYRANKRKRRPHPGRQTLPADLPRVEKVIACTPFPVFNGLDVFDLSLAHDMSG
jgi:hypothetical protein